MTTSLNFKTIEEYKKYMETARAEICSCTLQVLQEAYEDKDDNPCIMSTTIDGVEGSMKNVYEMCLSRDQWPMMLERCLHILSEDKQYANDAIETYLLLEKLKQDE